MYYVYFLENKNCILSQLRKQIPAVNEELRIKGRKAKVISVTNFDDSHVNVHVELEKIVKKPLVDLSKKKKK
ncbi:hypothetical protein FIU87_12785 [Bacillus sp. THAF10]|uniref:hypothetical protein n=1 Tax=Bacillus sp. THAF10 TaxID=2587848 RepID=UPI0012681AA7|nr:hypothetical protein [Bacillus sp. THAF10]QFT89528.1 hypothetical protein FIU87_12785 [Bacillus sp. THAF10]